MYYNMYHVFEHAENSQIQIHITNAQSTSRKHAYIILTPFNPPFI